MNRGAGTGQDPSRRSGRDSLHQTGAAVPFGSVTSVGYFLFLIVNGMNEPFCLG